MWLIDVPKVFEGQRYIVVMTPDISMTQQTTDPADNVEDMGNLIIKKLEHANKQRKLRQKIIDKNNKQMHKSNLMMLIKCKQLLETQLQTAKDNADDQ